MIEAVFFDLDDTLCDTVSSRPQRARKALDAFSSYHPDHDLEDLLRKALEPHATLERETRGLRSVFAELGLEESLGARAAYACYAQYFDPLHLIEGVTATLEHLMQGYRLGIITNGHEAVQQGKLEYFDLGRYIRWVVISESVGLPKPDPRIFSHALSLAGVEHNEAVFVGDRLDIDVGGAKAAGMRTVWFNHWGGNLDGDSPSAGRRHQAVRRAARRSGEVLAPYCTIRVPTIRVGWTSQRKKYSPGSNGPKVTSPVQGAAQMFSLSPAIASDALSSV